MENECTSHATLKVEIDHIKEDISNIKEEQKDDRKFYRETIAVLKENVIEIKILQQKADERLESMKGTNKWAWSFVVTFVLGVLGTVATLVLNKL